MTSSLSTEEQVDSMLTALKQALKTNRMSYRELAEKIGMTESGIKRVFSQKTLSVDLLSRICGAIGLTLFDLASLAKVAEPLSYRISKEAETFFEENFDAFVFYRELTSQENLGHFIRSNAKDSRLGGWIKSFEKLGLLRRTQGRSHEIVGRGYMHIDPDSRLHREIQRRWAPWLLAQATEGGDDHMLRIFSTGLSEQNFNGLKREIDEMILRYRQIGILDQQQGRTNTKSVGVCLALGPYRVGTFAKTEGSSARLVRGI